MSKMKVKRAETKAVAAGKAGETEEILYNRKLRHDFAVLDSWEAGLSLMGSEARSLREKNVQWGDAHARLESGECWLYGLHIDEWRFASSCGHLPQRPRRLLLKRKELDKIEGKLKGKGLTLIPEKLLFRKGWAKLVICLCQHKDHEDKRQDLMKKAQQRDVQREMARREKHRD
jgi:SsrA-binding protein